jgi:hypothetical protein
MKRFAPAAVALVAVAVYLAMFGAGDARAEQPISLWLPWEGGSQWTFTGGPHGDYAEALDFQPPDAAGKPCESFHSTFYVVAAADGTVSSERPNVIEIDHGEGFATAYYHLEAKLVKLGDEVRAGDRLGLPGCCPDGWGVEGCYSEAPHLHFYTLMHGVRQPAVGLNLGGWRVGEDYCLHRTADTRCEFGTRLFSNSPIQGNNTPSTGADLAVILDTSESVSEGRERIQTALALLQATRPDDRLTVIEFNSNARVRQPLTPAVNEADRRRRHAGRRRTHEPAARARDGLRGAARPRRGAGEGGCPDHGRQAQQGLAEWRRGVLQRKRHPGVPVRDRRGR